MARQSRWTSVPLFAAGMAIGLFIGLLIFSPGQVFPSLRAMTYRSQPVVDETGGHVGDVGRLAAEGREADHGQDVHTLIRRSDTLARRRAGHLDSINDQHVHNDNDAVAKKLAKHVRVLIWVHTSPSTLNAHAAMIKETWGKRAEKLLFFSSAQNDTFPAIGLNVQAGEDHQTEMTNRAFRYIYENHLNDAEWFMKVEDDTFVIVENLKYFLSEERSDKPVYFGHHVHQPGSQGYNSRGGGYVLSRSALSLFGSRGQDSNLCRQEGGIEDAELGHCMEKLGVKIGNTTDVLGRSRFHCFPPSTYISGIYPEWYTTYDVNGAKKGIASMSDYSVTFHELGPRNILWMYYYVYHLAPYGVYRGQQTLNVPKHEGTEVREQ